MVDMSFAGVRARDVLVNIKKSFPNNVSTLKTIYNAKAKMIIVEMEGRSAVQQLMKFLIENHYAYWVRKDETNDMIVNLMWAHPESTTQCKYFPSLLLLNYMYKTNRFKMPLLEMVGMTSTNRTFTIAYCFLSQEREDSYRWALENLKLMYHANKFPDVLITDKESSLI